jgi:hypothetical protein
MALAEQWILPTSEVRQSDSWRLLNVTLEPTSYDWSFLPAAGNFRHGSGDLRVG